MRKCYLSLSNVVFKILLPATIMLLTAIGGKAQVDITIGNGTTPSGNQTYPAPLQDWYEGSRMQYLYLASELTSAGMSPGNINALKLNVTSLNGFTGTIEQMTIKIGTTTASTLDAATWEPVSATVYGPVDYAATLGVNTFTFSSPFFWNGTSNLVIEICNGDPNNSTVVTYTENPSVDLTTNLSFNGSHSYRADNLGNLCGSTTTTNTGDQTSRPNTTLNWTSAAACSGAPNPGTVTPASATICVGGSYTFTATGVTVASGLSYQWEESSASTGPFTPISGATSLSYTSGIAAIRFIRFRVICNGTDTAYSNVVSVATGNIANGLYTIDNNFPTNASARTFNNFVDAYNFIKCGISAPVVFNVVNRPTPYNEQLVMNFVPGSSLINTVTFKGNGSTIGFAATNTLQRATIKLDSASFITFDSLIVNCNAGTSGYGIQLKRNSDYNTIIGCTINASATATNPKFAGIVINGTDTGFAITGEGGCDVNRIERNTINGGFYGIINIGSNSAGNGNDTIRNNKVSDFYQYGYFATFTYGNVIEHNIFSRPARVAPMGPFYGINFTNASSRASIIGNRCISPFDGDPSNTGAFYGINFENVAVPSGSDFSVINNIVAASNGNGLAYGIANNTSPNISYIHNTISLDYLSSTSTAAARGFSQTGTAGNLIFYNNIVSIARGGSGLKHALYFGTPANGIVSDYNDLYIAPVSLNSYVGSFNGNRTTLGAWQTASGQDLNSFSTDPLFLPGYTPQSSIIDNQAFYLLVDVDIDYTPRNIPVPPALTGPDIGAREYEPPVCIAPPTPGTSTIYGTNSFTDIVCYGTVVPLSLVDNSNGFSQTYQWESAATQNGTYTAIDTPRTSPDYLLTATATLWYRVSVKCGTSTVYSVPVLLNVKQRLAPGTYTINNQFATNYIGTAPANFNNFNEAKAAMSCGIAGPVIFNVQPGITAGVYTEQLRLDTIVNTSEVNTITFNGNGYKITANPTATNEKAVIKLCGTKHVTFNNLVIDASGGVSEGFGVHLLKDADSNTFRTCHIITSTTPTSNSYAGVVINGSHTSATAANNSNCDENLFDNNTITGGYYGIIATDSASVVINHNRFTGNLIEDFYSSGIYMGIGNSATLIEGNRITRPVRVNNNNIVYGIYATGAGSNDTLSKNKIYNLFGGAPASISTQYGIYHTDADATTNNSHLVVNNLIFRMTGAGPVYGIANSATDYINYWHNTIAIESMGANATGLSRGFYQTGTATGLQFKNNIVTITRDGTAAKHAIYVAASPSDMESNFNDFFVNATGANNYVGYYNNASQLTLADWQSATGGKDTNSFSIDPGYVNPALENYAPVVAPLDNQGTPLGVPSDINNNPRSFTTPDIGAFEFSVPPCTAPTITTATIIPTTGVCLGDPVTLNIPGAVSATGLTYTWQTSADGVTGWTDISGPLFFPLFNTTAIPTKYFRAIINCNGTLYYSTIVTSTLNLYLVAGDYSINPTLGNTYTGAPGANFVSFNAAVAQMLCGIGGHVRFHVSADIYTEQVLIKKIPYIGPNATVTFMAANGNAATSILTYNSTAATSNYTLKLDSINYVRFRNLSIQATNATNGRVVEFSGTSSYDSLVSCTITTPATTNAATAMAAVYANTLSGKSNAIVGNTITGGSSGIYFSGVAGGIYSAGDLIAGNTVSGSYAYGIYAGNLKRMKLQDNSISLASPSNASIYGIYATNCDTAYQVLRNSVNINNVTSTSYGVYLVNCASESDAVPSVVGDTIGVVAGNRIYAVTGNTGNVYGLVCSTDTGAYVVNNVIAIDSAGTTSYGLHSINSANTYYYNNSVLNADASATAYAAFFNQTTVTSVKIKNNIFVKKNKGKVLNVSTPTAFTGDYNMLWKQGQADVSDTTFAVGSNINYSTFTKWQRVTNWDKWSISYPPAFVSDADLRPDTTNPDSWAMHGRGTQIIGNGYDINYRSRPQTLIAGVPDLGAYEFHPTPATLPTVLTAIPASPTPGQMQTFMYGTDTVMKLRWTSSAPPSVEVRRYSGDVPPNLLSSPGLFSYDSMYFYNGVTFPGGGSYTADSAVLYYIDPWQGSISDQWKIGLGRTNALDNWKVEYNSVVNTTTKKITYYGIDTLPHPAFDVVRLFTGLVNPYAEPPTPEIDTSNRGRRFWTAYQRSYDMPPPGSNAQEMVLYFSTTDKPANVVVKINGLPWVRTYIVPPYTTVQSDLIPKGAPDVDPRLLNQGLYPYGISIESDVDITAYAHIYSGANSGATMLFPVGVWGYEYYTINNTQNYSATGAWNTIMAIADNDNTVVEITLANPDLAGHTPNVPFQVTLNRGDVYQVLGAMIGGSEGYDLTGSLVKSVSNSAGKCYPIAVFSGTSRTSLGCGGSTGSSGDLAFPQVFPYSAWGKHYMTAPTSNDIDVSSFMTNIYRVLVKNTLTVVKVNNVALPQSSIINNRYYQFESNTADEIIADSAILVAQYMSSNGACPNSGNDGDPDVFILSPVEQAVKGFWGFYRNNLSAIDENFMTIVLPNAGMNSLKVDGIPWAGIPAARKFSYPHTNPAYTVAVVQWAAPTGPTGRGQSSIETDSAFTGVVYGEGSVESYGYNVGTLVKNLMARPDTLCNQTPVDGCVPSNYTCTSTPFTFNVLLPVVPDYVTIGFSQIPGIAPANDTTLNNPVPNDTVLIGGNTYYSFTLTQAHVFSIPGTVYIPITYQHPSIEGCNHTRQDFVILKVRPSPRPIFNYTFPGCVGNTAQFIADSVTENGVLVTHWTWHFHDATTAGGPTAAYTYTAPGTYHEVLQTTTADGCSGDTARDVVVNPSSGVTLVEDTISICAGIDTAFYVLNPDTSATYYWYSTPTGGTPLDSGSVYNVTGVTTSVTYYVQGVHLLCSDSTRVSATLIVAAPLPTPVVVVNSVGANSIDFGWAAITGASGYLVSVDTGRTWITPSSGATGLTHTAGSLSANETVCILVRAIGTNACDTSLPSPLVCATVGCPILTITVVNKISCPGTPVTFEVLSPVPTYTYNWYDSALGVIPIATGTTFTTTSTVTDTFYVGAMSGACTISRVMVIHNILDPLAAPVAVVDSFTATCVYFSWNAVTGATGYQVSINNGPWIQPSTGATGLSHSACGFSPLDTVRLRVKVLGDSTCQDSISVEIYGVTICAPYSVAVVEDTVRACLNGVVSFSVLPPYSGTYNWYNVATGGTPVATGPTHSPTVTVTTNYWVEQVVGGCISTRTQVTAELMPQLAAPVVTCTVSGNSITFTWNSVPGAVGYQVNVNNQGYGNPSSGIQGLTHVVTNLQPLDTASIQVKVLGDSACQENISAPHKCQVPCNGFSLTVVRDTVTNCIGQRDILEVQNPQASDTYTWYHPAGTQVATGASDTITVTQALDSFFVQSTTAVGCTSAFKTVYVIGLSQLSPPTVTVSSSTPNSVTFNLSGGGAGGYEVTYTIGTTTTTITVPGPSVTVPGLSPQQFVTVSVKALGTLPCQISNATSQTGQASCNNVVIQALESMITHCANDHFVFNIQPGGNQYVWYTSPAATPADSFHTGQSLDTVLLATTSFYIQGTDAAGCKSPVIMVTGTVLPHLAAPVVALVDSTPTSLTFSWGPVTGASGYEVNVNNAPSWIPWTTTTYVVTPLIPLQSVTIFVRAVGGTGCQLSEPDTAKGKTLSDQVFIPNTFTPNGDGHNDALQVFSFGNVIKEMKMMIFSQWGEKVFESTNPQIGWDGKYKGKAQPVGVYIYVGKFTLNNGNVLDKKGSINLVR